MSLTETPTHLIPGSRLRRPTPMTTCWCWKFHSAPHEFSLEENDMGTGQIKLIIIIFNVDGKLMVHLVFSGHGAR